jgi:hypothetical protein
LYTGCVVTAGAVLYADCSVAAGADTHIKGFADTCYKDEKGVAESVTLEDIILKGVVLEGIVLKGILYRKDKEGEQRCERVIISLIRVKLRQLQKDIVIISLSLISVFASLSFV